MFENEGFNQEQEDELTEAGPTLSLKFAMPPVAQVNNSQNFQPRTSTPRCLP
jgi:hypothetical protein